MLSRDEIRALVIVELRAMAARTPGRGRPRREPAGLRRVLDDLKQDGVDLPAMRGQWRVVVIDLPRRRSGPHSMPCVERGNTQLFAASEERARELAGLLNWWEIGEDELHPETA